MLQKVTATLFLVVLSLALIACPSDSTTAGPALAAPASQTAITAGALTEYTLLFDKAVLAVATAGLTASEFTIKNGEAAAVDATEAKIVGTTGDDAKKVKLTFAEITFAKDAKVVFTVKANAVKDADGNENAATTVELTVGAAVADTTGPVLATAQAAISAGAGNLKTYTLEFDEAVTAVGTLDITKFTVTKGSDAAVTAATASIVGATGDDAKKVTITIADPGITVAENDTVKFAVAADAVQDAAGNKNTAEETTVTVGA